jgi:integrase
VWRPGAPPARERTLTDAEIVAFWRACNTIGSPFGPLFQIMLLTGVRLREAANMVCSELSADGVWTIPGSRTKNHRPLSLALPPLAQQIIAGVPNIAGAAYLFTTNGRTPVSGFSKAKRQLDAAITKTAGDAVPAYRLHDLRRTAASGMQRLGIRSEVIERTLNHVSGSFRGVTGIYQRDPLTDDVRDALARWATHLAGLVAAQTDKIVPMRKAGA